MGDPFQPRGTSLSPSKEVMIALAILLVSMPYAIAQTCDASTHLEQRAEGELIALSIEQISVSPPSEQAGTIFTLQTTLTDETTIASAIATITKDNVTQTNVSLYDDGQHNDQQPYDNVYANTFSSADFSAGDYDVTITTTNSIGQQHTLKEQHVFEITEGNCKSMHTSGSQQDKLDIIFVPCDYSLGEEAKFEADVQAHMDELLSFVPFNDYTDRINAYRVERLGEMSCTHNGRCLLAPSGQTQTLADECGSWDTIMVIADSTAWEGCAWLGGIGHASSRYPWITVHEFGHSFASLLDEYSYGSSGSTNGPNCDYAGCSRWSNLPGTGCYSGCNYDNLYRPTYDSTMRSALVEDFGPVNDQHIRGILDGYN